VKVAVLGLGEAGARIALDLVTAGVTVHGFDPAPRPVDGIVRAPDAASAVKGCEAVLSVTSAAAARHAAEAALPRLAAGAVYADLSTAAPALKRELATLVEPSGARFADVALLGPVPARGLGTPAIASGPGAETFAAAMEPFGMPVEVVSGEAGDAAGLKLLRSVFMKGLAAAALESLAAAEAGGHADWLREQIAGVIGASLLERLVEGSRTHATRRVEEMDAATELLVSLGVEPHVATASRALLVKLAEQAPE
jgi:3-hydroxyisobutyrate dehydrogenase-like beta-hydroxyacid dehydrogenase